MPDSAISENSSTKLVMARSYALDVTIFFACMKEVRVGRRDASTIREPEFTIEVTGLDRNRPATVTEMTILGEHNLLNILGPLARLVAADGREVRVNDRTRGVFPMAKFLQLPGFVATSM